MILVFCDAPVAWQVNFQDPASSFITGLINLHHDIIFLITVCSFFVLWVFIKTIVDFRRTDTNLFPRKITHGTFLEIVWTLIPCWILMLIAFPSFSLLYSMDEYVQPSITLKVIGHQWYWSYEYSDYNVDDNTPLMFDSYLLPTEDLEMGQMRLLEVDNRVVLPINTPVRGLITAADVLHSWAVSSLGVKCDAVPGRLNMVTTTIDREGVFFGQCSELCGTNHGFIPIVVEGVSLENYSEWLQAKCLEE